MDSIAIWLTTTPGLITISLVALVCGLAGLYLVIFFNRGFPVGGGYALLFASVSAIFCVDTVARGTYAPPSFLASIGPCERQKLVAATSPQSPITIGDVRRAERHCEELAEQAPQREADSRTRAEQNAVLSASADPS